MFNFCLQNLLLEASAHFEFPISRLIFIYRYRDDTVKALEKKFKKNGLFLDTIPSNLESQVCEHCVIVIDDMEDLLNTKEMAAMTLRFANFIVHHSKIIFGLVFQSYNLFYASSRLHSLLYQATLLICFRSVTSFGMLKRVLNSYNVKLKDPKQKLYDLFTSYVNSRHKYLIINVSPALDCPLVYTGVLYNDNDPFITFN